MGREKRRENIANELGRLGYWSRNIDRRLEEVVWRSWREAGELKIREEKGLDGKRGRVLHMGRLMHEVYTREWRLVLGRL